MTSENPTRRETTEILAVSAATERFKQAVHDLEAGRPQDAISHNRQTPPVKALRVALKVLEEHPDEPIDALRIEARSNCSALIGEAAISPGAWRVRFEWDCAWRAETLGWRDAFGFPDQIRAAREYGYQCFRTFESERPARA